MIFSQYLLTLMLTESWQASKTVLQRSSKQLKYTRTEIEHEHETASCSSSSVEDVIYTLFKPKYSLWLLSYTR